MKVFCTNCIFFVEGERISFPFGNPKCSDYKSYNINPDMYRCEIKEKCLSSSNFKDNYEKEKEIFKSIPSIINQFNDCKWYVPKGEASSSSSSSSSSSESE